MPLYFFDVTDNGRGLPDTEGTELADLEAARQEALATLGEIARDKLPDGDRREFVIRIRDGDTSLMRATLSLVVQRF
jgi:citrate lyase beta subunit